MRTKNYFKIYNNGKYLGDTQSASLKECRRYIRDNFYHTHMGEWKKRPTGYLYATTIGSYIDFVRFGKEASK